VEHATSSTDKTISFLPHFGSGYPIVKSLDTMQLIGYVSRSNLETVLSQKGPDITPDSPCFFTTDRPFPRNTAYLDFNPWLDQSPIQVTKTPPHPKP
jgi:hypothetical protein